MAIVMLLVFVVNICSVLCAGTISLEYKPSRPSYAGATGGTWGSYVGQLIPPGKPWPSKAEDYEGFSAASNKTNVKDEFTTNPTTTSEVDITLNTTEVSLEDRIKDTTTTSSPLGLGSSRPQDEVITVPQLPVPNRPPFIGATGGNFIPQSIPPGKPWPARPEDYDGFNATSQKPNVEQTINETTTIVSTVGLGSFRPEDEIITVPQLPVPNRPPFIGPTGGNFIPQIIPPGKPWPARPEDYEGFNATSQKPNVEQAINDTTTIVSTVGLGSFSPEDEIITVPQLPVPNRPPFIGPTGGNFIPQIIPPGKPWPARPEDYEGFNATSQKPNVEQVINDTTTIVSTVGLGSFIPEDEIITVPQLPVPNRPPFIGPTGGNFIPQIIPPGKPWPARPEDYEGFNKTSQKPNVEGSFNETTTLPSILGSTFRPAGEVITTTELPESHKSVNATSQKSSIDETIKVITTVSNRDSGDDLDTLPKIPVPNRLHLTEDAGEDVIPLIPLLENSSPGLEGNKSGTLNLEEGIEEVTEASLMINETGIKAGDNQTYFGSKMPLLSIYINLEDIKHAIESKNKEIDKDANKYVANDFMLSEELPGTDDTSPIPSLVVSLDLEALKRIVEKSTNESQKKESIKITELSLPAENITTNGTQNEDGINHGHFRTSANNTTITFNISHSVASKTDESNPFISIFFNTEDFKTAMADFSHDNEAEASAQYFQVVPSKITSGSTTVHPSFPHLGLGDTSVHRNVSTLITQEAEKVLA